MKDKTINNKLDPLHTVSSGLGHTFLRRQVVTASIAAALAGCGGGGSEVPNPQSGAGSTLPATPASTLTTPSPSATTQPGATRDGPVPTGGTGTPVNGQAETLPSSGSVAPTIPGALLENLSSSAQLYYTMKNALIERLESIKSTCTGQGTTINNCSDIPNLVFPNPNSLLQSGNYELARRISGYLFGSYGTNQFNNVLNTILTKYIDNAGLMYAIIINEQSHLLPPIVEDAISGTSVGLSQIRINPTETDRQYFGFTNTAREDLLDPIKHLEIMNDRIDKIKSYLIKNGIDPSPDTIGRIWNGGYNCINSDQYCPDSAIAYGNITQDYFDFLIAYLNIYTTK